MILIEDQMLMRVLVAESLEAAGFSVSAYADASSALEEFDSVDPDAHHL
ncbi:hypothetical protein GCM10009563_06660 [Subtercola frigoramans]